nr:MAG TPA: SAGA-associated factor 73-FINGER, DEUBIQUITINATION, TRANSCRIPTION FACTOR, SAGA [Caudoviricetes sp.]
MLFAYLLVNPLANNVRYYICNDWQKQIFSNKDYCLHF